MMKQLVVGLVAEGTTDYRFLKSVLVRAISDILLNECEQYVELYTYSIKVEKAGLSFPQFVVAASSKGISEYGIMTLAVHTDADRETYEQRIADKFVPAQSALDAEDEEVCCKCITPIIPVRMIESWMLADKELFKREIGTTLSDRELGIDRNPEQIASPKDVIEEAIRRATAHLPKRRHRITISDLYGYIGDAIDVPKLATLSSFARFQDAIRVTLRTLNYIH